MTNQVSHFCFCVLMTQVPESGICRALVQSRDGLLYPLKLAGPLSITIHGGLSFSK